MGGKQIILSIEGTDVPAEKLVAVIKDFYALLAEVSSEVGEHKRAKWVAHVKEGSNQVVFSPERGETAPVERIAGALIGGLAQLEKDPKGKPEHFNFRALGHAHNLGRVFHPDRDRGHTIRVLSDGHHQEITERVSVAAERFLGARHEDEGAVEGHLQVISGHNGFRYRIYDDLTDKPVECESPSEKEKAIKEFVLGAFEKRVAAYGTIRYNAAGRPECILVRELKVLKDDSELPTVEDMQRLFAR
jgi:hypothetical protein